MTDIFLSYSRDDMVRVRKVRDAFDAHGFLVFWDQNIPKGIDWNIWIKDKLSYARLAVVLWSKESLQSKPVIQEAAIAEQLGRQYPVWIDELEPSDFTLLGQFTTNAAKLTRWQGAEYDPADMQALLTGIEARLMPAWAMRRVDRLQASLDNETALRRSLESKSAASMGAHQDLIEELVAARTALDTEKARSEKALASSVQDREDLAAADARIKGLEGAAQDAAGLREEIGRLKAELNVYRRETDNPERASRWDQWPHITTGLFGQRLLRIEPARFVLPCYRRSDAALIQLTLEIEHPFVITEDFVSEGDWRKIMPKQQSYSAPVDLKAPRTSVSFDEAEEYIRILNDVAGGGYFMMSEREWYFVSRSLAGVRPDGDGSPVQSEWLSGDWIEYAALVDPGSLTSQDPGSAYKLMRYDAIRADQEKQQHFRQRWLRSYRSDSLGFRVARRV